MIDRRQFLVLAPGALFLPMVGAPQSGFDLSAVLRSGASVIAIPPGEHLITTPIVWPVGLSNITLRGAGIGATTLVFVGMPIGMTIGSSQAALTNITIADMSLRGQANDDTAPDELIQVAYTVSDVRVRNVDFSLARKSGLRFTSNTFGRGALIDACTFHDIATPQMTAVQGGALQGAPHDTIVRACRFVNTGNNDLHHAFYASAPASEAVENLTIEGCTFLGQNTRLHCYSNTRTRVLVEACRFVGNSAAYFDNTPGAVVSGNLFDDTQVRIAASDVLFAGNTLLHTHATWYEQMILSGDAAAVTANRFERRSALTGTAIDITAGGHTIAGNTGVNLNIFVTIDAGDRCRIAGNITSNMNNVVRVRAGAHAALNNVCTKLQSLDFAAIYGGSLTQQGNIIL